MIRFLSQPFVFRRLIFTLLFGLSISLSAQEQKKDGELKRIVVIRNNKFAVYNNWLSIDLGYSQSINSFDPAGTWFNGGLDYNFHLRTKYFQTGVLVSGEHFNYYSFYQAHIAYCWRKETEIYNRGLFAGPSLSQIFPKINGKYILTPYQQLGIYVCAQLIYKVTYDVGVGLSAFCDLNSRQTTLGLRVTFYFSGAFKGKKDQYQ